MQTTLRNGNSLSQGKNGESPNGHAEAMKSDRVAFRPVSTPNGPFASFNTMVGKRLLACPGMPPASGGGVISSCVQYVVKG